MNQPEIYNIIKKAVENVMQQHNNRLVITPKSDFIQDLDFDYIDKIKMYTEVEQKTELEFSEMEIDLLDTIEELILLTLSKFEQKYAAHTNN